MAAALTHERDAAVSKAKPGVRHLPHQGVEPDAPVAEVCCRDHHSIPNQVYVRSEGCVAEIR